MYMYMYMHMYMYVYVYMYMYVYVCVYVYIYMHTHTYIYTHVSHVTSWSPLLSTNFPPSVVPGTTELNPVATGVGGTRRMVGILLVIISNGN